MLQQAKWPTEDLGIASEAGRRRKLYADYAYQAPTTASRVHRINVDCKTGKRTVETVDLSVRKPALIVIPAAPAPAPKIKRRPGMPLPVNYRVCKSGDWRAMKNSEHIRERVSDIIFVAAEAFGVAPAEMMTECRARRVAYPRFAAMHLMRSVLRISMPSIGRVFKRDHTTVLAALGKAAVLRGTNRDFIYRSRAIARALRKRWSVAGQSEAQQ